VGCTAAHLANEALLLHATDNRGGKAPVGRVAPCIILNIHTTHTHKQTLRVHQQQNHASTTMLPWSPRTLLAQSSKPSQAAAQNRLPIILFSGLTHASLDPGAPTLSKHPKHAQYNKNIYTHLGSLSMAYITDRCTDTSSSSQ
jgi:hypothetical protein